MYKQLIILREKYDNGYILDFGKGCAMASHASMAFLTHMIQSNIKKIPYEDSYYYSSYLKIDKDLYEGWIGGIFTKIICRAKNKNQLLKAVDMAKELNLEEGKDFYLITDLCKTCTAPEFVDENGVGRVLVGIGFIPMESEIIEKISKKFQLYK